MNEIQKVLAFTTFTNMLDSAITEELANGVFDGSWSFEQGEKFLKDFMCAAATLCGLEIPDELKEPSRRDTNIEDVEKLEASLARLLRFKSP